MCVCEPCSATMASDYVVVIVKLGPSVLLQATNAKVFLSSSFWNVFEGLSTYFSGRTFSSDDILLVYIGKDQRFISSNTQCVQLHHDVLVCVLFDCKFVLFNLKYNIH